MMVYNPKRLSSIKCREILCVFYLIDARQLFWSIPTRVTSNYSLLTINLRLKNGVADTPHSRGQEEQMRLVGRRPPYQQPRQQPRVDHRSQRYDALPADVLHGRAEDDAADGVDHAEADHHVPQLGDAQGAGDVRLREFGADKRLLHADVHGEDDEELLVGLLHLVRGGGQELDRGQLR